MGWRTAFSSLAAVTVEGVSTCYDLDGLPDVLPAADLPALAPAFEDASVGRERNEGLVTLTYDGAAWLATLTVDHVLYWCPTGLGGGLMGVLPDLLDAVDAYLAAVSADGTLDGTLHAPLVIERVQVGQVGYGGVSYYGARFRHRWVQVVAA